MLILQKKQGNNNSQSFIFAQDYTERFTYTDGNRVATRTGLSANWDSTYVEAGMSTGKHYAEFINTVVGTNVVNIGISSDPAADKLYYVGGYPTGWGFLSDGRRANNAVISTYGNSWNTAGNILGFAYDADNGELYFSINGVWQEGSNPSTGTAPAYSGITGSSLYMGIGIYGHSGNMGAQFTIPTTLTYSPPAGYSVLL